MHRALFHIKDRPDASPFRESDRCRIGMYPYEVVDSERAPFLRRKYGTVELLFPLSFYRKGASVQKMQTEYLESLSAPPYPASQSPPGNLPASAFVYCTYLPEAAAGCEHYASHFTFHCDQCEKEGLPADHACRRCHDDLVYTHELGRANVSRVTCVTCGASYALTDDFAGCPECDREGTPPYVCADCLIISDIFGPENPVHHCKGCGHCIRGDPACTRHCEKCNRCYALTEYDSHNCIPQVGGCTFCLDNLDTSTAPYHLLGCGSHYAHDHCLSAYLTSGEATSRQALTSICPVCRREILKDHQNDATPPAVASQLQLQSPDTSHAISTSVSVIALPGSCSHGEGHTSGIPVVSQP